MARENPMRTVIAAMMALLVLAPAVIADDATPAEPRVVEDNDAVIPMRDGKELAAKILLPEERGKYPCILVQTPYDKGRMGAEVAESVSEVARGSQKAWAQFDREHYAYVFVDWRGFYGSKAAMQGVSARTGWKRGQDGYDCVEWCAKQPWCDGKVGTWGGSALGKQQFDTICEQPPHLECAAPLIAAQGFNRETYFEGNVMIESMVKGHDKLGFGVGELVTRNRLPGRIWEIAETRSYTPDKINVPCLMVSGWWDNFPRQVINQYEDILAKGGGKANESKLIMGPWSHTAVDTPEQGDLKFKESEDYSTRITLKFFDYYLRGIEDSGWKDVAKVNVFQCHENEWISADSWDKLTGKPASWYLGGDGKVGTAMPPPATEEKPLTRQYKYDPKDPSPTIGGANLPPLTHGPKDVSKIAARKDVLVYETDKLDKALAVRGVVELTVYFRCNRVDTDIHARLCDEDGKACYLVGETIIRAKLRDGENVELLTPGEAYSVTLRFHPHAYTWQKDHRLKLIVTGGNAPRYEPNTHTGADAFDKAGALDVDVTILHDAEHATELVLPVVE
jgi:predicted acyl esterase